MIAGIQLGGWLMLRDHRTSHSKLFMGGGQGHSQRPAEAMHRLDKDICVRVWDRGIGGRVCVSALLLLSCFLRGLGMSSLQSVPQALSLAVEALETPM